VSILDTCIAPALLISIPLAPGCRREEVTHFRVSKVHHAASARSSAAPPAAMAGEVAAPPAPASALQWTLPRGWTATLVGGMRYATLKPPVEGRIDVSVVVLPGPAGGELANVNRWRGQLGLGAIDEPALASVRQAVQTKAGPLSVYDFTSEGEKKSRMVAGLAFLEGNSWFVKMIGDAGAVAAARADFIHLLQSLHFD
jgi:hypothetical protein